MVDHVVHSPIAVVTRNDEISLGQSYISRSACANALENPKGRPGWSSVSRIGVLTSSFRNASENPRSAYLLALYIASFAMASRPIRLPMLMMCPF
jgi:hypothetical protein